MHMQSPALWCTVALVLLATATHGTHIKQTQNGMHAQHPTGANPACGDAKGACQWAADWAFNGTRWNGTQLPYVQLATGPPTTLATCCAACRDTPGCVFFDLSDTRGCQLFDVSVFFNPAGRLNDSTSTASFIDVNSADGFAWRVPASQIVRGVPGDALSGAGIHGCAASCADTCGCALYQVHTQKYPSNNFCVAHV